MRKLTDDYFLGLRVDEVDKDWKLKTRPEDELKSNSGLKTFCVLK